MNRFFFHDLQRQAGNHLNEFLSLSRETDPELFYEGLYNLGVRLEQSGQVGGAASVYSVLASGNGEAENRGNGESENRRNGELNPSPIPRFTVSPVLQRHAQERLNALRGEGSVGLRLEVLGRSFARQAMAPAPLIGMGVAGLAFRGMNLFAATRLANLSAGLLTRGPGLRLLSGLAGFAAEVPAFTLTGRAVDRLLTGNVGAQCTGPEALGGRTQGPPLLEEMASAALVLGSLKLFGLGFGQLGNRIGVRGSEFGVGALQQAGMLTGIMAGHGLEVAFGLRERQNASNFLAESLVTLAQFNVAGRLSHSVFGERYARLQQSLAMQAEVVGRVRSSEFPPEADQPMAEGVRSRIQRIIEQMRDRLNGPPLAYPDTLRDGRSYMVGQGEGGQNPPGGGNRRHTQPFAQAFLDPSRSPHQIEGPLQLIRRILDPSLKFREMFLAEHVTFHVRTREGFDPKRVVDVLNRLSWLNEIPRGRKLTILFEDKSHPVTIIKLGLTFIEKHSSPPPPPPTRNLTPPPARRVDTPSVVSGAEPYEGFRSLSELATVAQRMERISARPPSPVPPAGRKPPSTIPPMPLVPAITEKPEGVPWALNNFFVVRTPQDLQDKITEAVNPTTLALRTEVMWEFVRPLQPSELHAVQSRLSSLREGRSFFLHDRAGRKTVRFSQANQRVWVDLELWRPPATFTPLHAEDLMDLLRQLVFLNTQPAGSLKGLSVEVRGPWKISEHTEMLGNSLNHQPLFPLTKIELQLARPRGTLTAGILPVYLEGRKIVMIRSEEGIWRQEKK